MVKLSLKYQFWRRQILSSSWFLYVYRWRSQQTLFRTPFNWVPISGKLDFWLKLVCFNFSIIIYSFVCRFLLHNYSYYYNQKQPSSGVLQERFSYKFCKIQKKTPVLEGLVFGKIADLHCLTLSKKRYRHRCFLVNFAKFLITPFS